MEDQRTPDQNTVDQLVLSAHGDLDQVKEILGQHPGLVNARARWGESPLEAAAQTGERAIAEYLLGLGAPWDICTAAMLGKIDRVEAFLRADPSLAQARGAHNIPVMYYPILHGETGVAELLLTYGADVNAGDGVLTPLHGAAVFNRPDMAGWLLAHGAREDVKDSKNRTPLQVAEASGHAELAEILRKHRT